MRKKISGRKISGFSENYNSRLNDVKPFADIYQNLNPGNFFVQSSAVEPLVKKMLSIVNTFFSFSLEMEEERHYNETMSGGVGIRGRNVSSPVPYNPSPSCSRPLSPGKLIFLKESNIKECVLKDLTIKKCSLFFR